MGRLKFHSRLQNHFDYQHKNPPPAFNPQFKHYAKKVWQETVSELDDEGWYDNTTLAERQANNLLVQRYEQKMKIASLRDDE